MELINKFLEFELLNIGTYHLKVSPLFLVLLIVIITKVVLIVIKQSIFRQQEFR